MNCAREKIKEEKEKEKEKGNEKELGGTKDFTNEGDIEEKKCKSNKLSNRMFPMIFTKKILFSNIKKKDN